MFSKNKEASRLRTSWTLWCW